LGKREINIETNKKGILTLYNEINSENAVYIIVPESQYLQVPIGEREVKKALSFKKNYYKKNLLWH
jgi:hypothetical protein